MAIKEVISMVSLTAYLDGIYSWIDVVFNYLLGVTWSERRGTAGREGGSQRVS